MVDLSVVEALGAAKERVEKGWCRGEMKKRTGEVCILGALMYRDLETPQNYDIGYELLERKRIREAAEKHIASYLRITEPEHGYVRKDIAEWNDDIDRRKEEVVCAFAKAIDLAIDDAYKGEV